jgi:hypothetical protein
MLENKCYNKKCRNFPSVEVIGMSKKAHALVVGGTGMLADVCLWLTNNGYHVSVIGRNGKKHQHLNERALYHERITNLIVDYTDYESVKNQLRQTMNKYGPINLVVSWSQSNDNLEVMSQFIATETEQWLLYHVKGSRRYFQQETIQLPPNCLYREVYLGFVLEGNHSRWLTHEEISQGVIRSLIEDQKKAIVGTLEPYEKRPSY